MISNDVLSLLCLGALSNANHTLKSIGNYGLEEVYDAHVTDISTKGDMAVSQSLITYFRNQNLGMVIESEESGKIKLFGGDKNLYITFDDIDGTDNYHRGKGMLPHCSVITMFNNLCPRYNDAIVAGIIEHNTGNYWTAIKGEGTKFNGKPCFTSEEKNSLDKRTNILLDLYMTPEIEVYNELNKKTWCKDFGSSGFHYASVSNGMFHGFVNANSKGHENGAGYLLITEAGGKVTDFQGKDFGSTQYEFNERRPLIAAANNELLEEIADIMKK